MIITERGSFGQIGQIHDTSLFCPYQDSPRNRGGYDCISTLSLNKENGVSKVFWKNKNKPVKIFHQSFYSVFC